MNEEVSLVELIDRERALAESCGCRHGLTTCTVEHAAIVCDCGPCVTLTGEEFMRVAFGPGRLERFANRFAKAP